jgi:hypothetical protein
MKKIRLRKWVKVALIIAVIYMVFAFIDKKDEEAIKNCSETYNIHVCERMVYGY